MIRGGTHTTGYGKKLLKSSLPCHLSYASTLITKQDWYWQLRMSCRFFRLRESITRAKYDNLKHVEDEYIFPTYSA